MCLLNQNFEGLHQQSLNFWRDQSLYIFEKVKYGQHNAKTYLGYCQNLY